MEKRVLTLELVVEQNTKMVERLDRSMAQLTQAMADLRVEMRKGFSDLRQKMAHGQAELRKEMAADHEKLRADSILVFERSKTDRAHNYFMYQIVTASPITNFRSNAFYAAIG